MIIYKLTRQDRTTRDGFKYPPKGNKLPELNGEGGLCSGGFYHGYANPLLAALHAPIHVDSDYTKMIEIEVSEVYAPNQMKLGFTTGIVGRVIPLPKITDEQRKRYTIGCVCSVYQKKFFRRWANSWISGRDRSRRAASVVASTVALEADWVDVSATRTTASTAAWSAAKAACEVDWSTTKATLSVARAARAATFNKKDLDLIRIAKWAMTDEPLSELLEGRE